MSVLQLLACAMLLGAFPGVSAADALPSAPRDSAAVGAATPPPPLGSDMRQKAWPLSKDHMERITKDLVLSVRIEGKGPYHFRVETSWPTTIISEELAQSLGLRRDGDIRLRLTAGAVEDHDAYILSQISVDNAVHENLRVAAMDPAGLEAWTRSPYDGVLGWDFIRNFVFEVDYGNGAILTYDPATFVPPDSGFALQAGADIPVVQALYDHKYPAWFALGTGLDKSLFLYHRFVEANRLWRGGAPEESTQFWSPAGQRAARILRHREIDLGGRVLQIWAVVASKGDPEDAEPAGHVDGELSCHAFTLPRSRVTLDGPHGRVHIEQPLEGPNIDDPDPVK
jgi:hypothetical protein